MPGVLAGKTQPVNIALTGGTRAQPYVHSIGQFLHLGLDIGVLTETMYIPGKLHMLNLLVRSYLVRYTRW